MEICFLALFDHVFEYLLGHGQVDMVDFLQRRGSQQFDDSPFHIPHARLKIMGDEFEDIRIKLYAVVAGPCIPE